MARTVLVALVLALTACAGQDAALDGRADRHATGASAPAIATSGVPPLRDGVVTPGRYRFVVPSTCDPALGCPTDKVPALPALDITVPEGWDAATDVLSLFTAEGRDQVSRDGAALVLGWTNAWVGLNSQPCSLVSHHKPDIAVGPTVQDFVDAVASHPLLDITEPRPVVLGRYSGQFFSLTGPRDISACEEWRPWDPGPYAQGTDNHWDLWVMDVAGVRVVIMAEYFPETPDDVTAELHAMAESIRFSPAQQS